ncbi:unnamed protein product [Rotaria socialis]
MTHIEEKLYLRSILDAIDEVYKLKNHHHHHHQQTSTYEERLTASFNKLLVPDWYNHDYTSTNELRKTKSHGQVSRTKRHEYKTSDLSLSSSNNSTHLSNGKHRHRSPSRSRSERPSLRNNSTTSSYDTNESIIIHNRRLTNSHETSTYVPGLQRVTQSSTWYKPKTFIINDNNNGHSIQLPKPLPRHSKINQDSTSSTDYSSLSSTSNILITDHLVSNETIRHPLKPRIMSQAPIQIVETNESSCHGDVTIVQEPTSSRTVGIPSSTLTTDPDIISSTANSNNNMSQSMTVKKCSRDSKSSVSSDVESFHSMVLPSSDKNLQATDSSSYASINEQCLSSATSSYHTAIATDDMSSTTDYETPTLKLENEILSAHSSMSDLSNAETLEPNVDDLNIVVISKEEQKSAIIPPVNVGMENLPLPHILCSTSSPSPSPALSDSSPSTESRPIENNNWYDNGSIDTCIHQTSLQSPTIELREIDLNVVGDEFYLFSPRNTTDDEPSSSMSDDKHDQEFEQLFNSKQMPTHLYSNENETTDDVHFFDEFHCSSTVDPFGYKHNNKSAMITNLDDLPADYDNSGEDDNDDEGNHLKDRSTYLLNTNYRRPIQEDILYEVEHENSYSDNSQQTTSLILADESTSISIDPNLDFLTTLEEPSTTDIKQTSLLETILQSNQMNSSLKQPESELKTLPINIPPSPMYTSTQKSSSLHTDISTYPSIHNYELSTHQYSDFALSSSPSSYTPKIRHRHISVGSYYDNKTTTVAIHPNHTLYILGSAPVSPLSRTAACETHYHSPISYGNASLNTLRRMTPYFETNTLLQNYDYQQTLSSSNRDDQRKPATVPSMEQTQSVFTTKTELPLISPSLPSPPPPSSIHTSSVIVEEHEEPAPPILASPSPPPRFDVPLVRPKTSRGRVPPIPPIPPPRTTSIDKEQTQSISFEIDSASSDNEKTTTINDDLQFIRGTIERVFDHHGESTTSESSICNEELSDDKNDESISESNSSKTLSKKSDQYPAVEAVQRFYQAKPSSEAEEKSPKQQETNIDNVLSSNHSSTTGKLYSRSNPINIRKKQRAKSNSADDEQASSEEVDDTLNDIEEDDYQDDKLKRQPRNNSSHTSYENSPTHSSNNRIKLNKASQETQTMPRLKQTNITVNSASSSQTTIQSYDTANSTVPPIDITTQMVIERSDSFDDAQIGEITGDMVIFYDDIEIVEHSSNISTSESDSFSSMSKSLENDKLNEPTPPPIPARALKPVHLLDNQQQQQQQQSPAVQQSEPIIISTSKINRIYELEKSTIRKKFDVNSVNTMINRNDYFMGPIVAHRHPSARHFVGKLNNDDIASRNSALVNSNTAAKPSSTMIKSQTLPLQYAHTNGHTTNIVQDTPTKSSFSTLPIRAVLSADTNEKSRSPIADTNALVKQIQNSLSRNSLHDTQFNSPLSISTKDLRTFVSSTYSPSDENVMDDNGIVHVRQQNSTYYDDQSFQRQARLSKSFHNVSEYSSTDQHPKNDNHFIARTQPSKSVENNLHEVSSKQTRNSQMILNFPRVAASTSFSTLPHSDDNARLLSMKWYTGQVSENSEICYNTPHIHNEDLLFNYISAHSSRETQMLLARLQTSTDTRIHAALDDVRLRVAQFDASKSPDDIHIFMRYLESRLRDISSKNLSTPSATTTAARTSNRVNGQRRLSNGTTATNGYHSQQQQQQQSDALSIKSRTNSIVTGVSKETPPQRQVGRQQLRSNGSKAGEGGANGHQPLPPPRRASQTSVNQENPAVFDDMLNTVLGLPKKGVTTPPPPPPPPPYPSSQSREKLTPLAHAQISANTIAVNNLGNDIGKRLFESGTYKDPRLIYDGPRQNEKEEQPLETSV